MTLDEGEMCKPGMVLATTAFWSRLKRKRCHMRGMDVIQSARRAVKV